MFQQNHNKKLRLPRFSIAMFCVKDFWLSCMNPSKSYTALSFLRNQDLLLTGKFLEDDIGPNTTTAGT